MSKNNNPVNDRLTKKDMNNIDVGKLGIGAGMMWLAPDRVLGKKTMYHGTNNENAEKIFSEGLKASKGGTGASEVVTNARYVASSKGKVHLTGDKSIASIYSNLNPIDSPTAYKRKPFAEKYHKMVSKYSKDGIIDYSKMTTKEIVDFENLKSMVERLSQEAMDERTRNMNRTAKGGKILKVKMDYDKFKSMEVDPDQVAEVSKNKFYRHYQKHTASRGPIDISPEEIVGSKASKISKVRRTIKKLPQYIKNNPARFGAGIALGIGGAAMTANGIKNLYDRNLKKEAKHYYIDLIEKQAATTKDVWSTYKEKNEVPFKMRDAFTARAPENFRGMVKTKIRPDAYDGEIGYDIISTGAGRKNQILEATSGLRDVPRIRKKEDELEEFDNRMKPHYDKLIKNKKNVLKDVLVGTSTGAMGGALLGKDKNTRLSGAIIGGATGLAGGVAANGLGRINAQKSIIKNLTDDERETLLSLKKSYGSDHTQRATSAHRLIGKNYYAY